MKSKRSKKRKALIAIIAVVVILLGVFGAAYGFYHSKISLMNFSDGKWFGTIDENDKDVQGDAADMDKATAGLDEREIIEADGGIYSSKSVFNILLIGTDERSEDFSTNARGDTCMLLSINKSDGSIKLTSFERGMGVPILDGEYKGQYDWLTHTFRYGGADLMMREIQECFKVEVNKYVRVNLSTFIDGIDAIGGIDIDLTQAEADYINYPKGTYAEYHIAEMEIKDEVQQVKAGTNHLNGATAILYARCRYIDSDWVRVKRQQKVIKAAADQVKNLSVSELNNLLNTVLPLVQTNLKESEISSLLLSAPKFLNAQIESMTLPEQGTYGSMTGMGGRKLFAANFETNSKIIHKYIYGKE